MLLIDQILQKPDPSQLTPEMVEGLTLSAKFVLDASISIAADSMAPEQFDRVRKFVRPPYKCTWIETLQSDRPHFAAGNPPGLLEVPPRRVGVLIDALTDDLLSYRICLFWDGGHYGGWCTSAITLIVDYDGHASKLYSKLYRGAHAVDLTHEGKVVVHDGLTAIANPAYLSSIARTGDIEFIDIMGRQAIKDWGGELNYWTMVLALLSTRNLVDSTERVGREKINKARIRRGKPPLYEYHVCKLMIGRRYRAQAGTVSERDIRGHFVRGHYKVRKSGIYWWSPHKRGDFALGKIEKDYQVFKEPMK